MNIDPNYSSEDSSQPTAETAMEDAMGWLFENFIEEKENELTEEQSMLLAVIGVTFKTIASRADAYDKLQSNKDYFSRN